MEFKCTRLFIFTYAKLSVLNTLLTQIINTLIRERSFLTFILVDKQF